MIAASPPIADVPCSGSTTSARMKIKPRTRSRAATERTLMRYPVWRTPEESDNGFPRLLFAPDDDSVSGDLADDHLRRDDETAVGDDGGHAAVGERSGHENSANPPGFSSLTALPDGCRAGQAAPAKRQVARKHARRTVGRGRVMIRRLKNGASAGTGSSRNQMNSEQPQRPRPRPPARFQTPSRSSAWSGKIRAVAARFLRHESHHQPEDDQGRPGSPGSKWPGSSISTAISPRPRKTAMISHHWAYPVSSGTPSIRSNAQADHLGDAMARGRGARCCRNSGR